MRTCFIHRAAALLLLLGGATQARAQLSPLQPANSLRQAPALREASQYYASYQVHQLDVAALQAQLAGAPLEFTGGPARLLTLPLPQGGLATFKVYESPVLSPALAAQHPGIKTYSVQAVSGPATGRLSLIDGVLQAVLFQADGDREVYFQRVKMAGNPNAYLSYSTGQVKALLKTGPNAQKNNCATFAPAPLPTTAPLAGLPGAARLSGATLRTYKLAVSANKEFTNAKGGGTQAGGFAAVVVMVNVIKGVYRRELSTDFTLVSGTNTICTNAVNPTTFDNTNIVQMLGQNQTFQDAQVGNASYDVGHVLGYTAGSSSGGGVAAASSVCVSARKAQGASQVNQPDANFPQVFSDQLFAHEMGHQFSMSHSYNSSVPVCTTRAASTSVEPGSGATIMSYSYTCSDATGDDDYLTIASPGAVPYLNFHAVNTAQALAYMAANGNCSTNTSTGNAVPTVNTVSTGFTIPKSTPFALTGTASGGAGTLTYSWEGTDPGATAQGGTVPTTELGDASQAPFFRTYAPMSTGTRTFPLLAAILNGTNQAKGDKLPSVGRVVNLRLTVRDGLGGVDEKNSAITVAGNSGPFLETTNLAGTYASGSSQAITWSVNNTTAAPVSCANVSILLSTDGGLTFPTTLLASTANDGTQAVTLPNLGTATSQARIKVQAVGNVFFDISNANFTISAMPALTIATGTVNGSPFCAGSPISVPFTASAAPNAGNGYTAQLSDASGSFAAPASLGTLASVATNGTIAGTLPATTPAGSGYRVRVVGSDPATTGTDNGANLTVNNTPTPTGNANQAVSNGAVLSDLTVSGTAIKFYAAANGGTDLPNNTVLVNGTTYYASQTANGCESTGRLAISVTVGAPAATDLIVSTGTAAAPTAIPAATYNSITVTNAGFGQFAGPVVVNTSVVVNGGLSTNCQPLTGAGSFTLAAGATLVICDAAGIAASGASGAVQTTGPRSFSTDASYEYNGTVAQITGTGLPARVRNLSTTNNGLVTLTAPTSVSEVLTLNNGSLALNNQVLTMLSDATGTALVVNNSTGTALGNITMQRYIDPTLNPGLGYRHLSTPVANTAVADLATGSFTPEVSQAAAYNASATPGTISPFPTVFRYDQARVSLANSYAPFDRGFVVPASTATVLATAKGYAVNMAGGQTVDFVGQLNTGAAILPLNRTTGPDAGWQLLGNPYPSPMDFSLVAPAQRVGFDASMYVYSSSSQYLGTYRSYVNGVGGNPVLPLGQGFFVRVSAGQTSGTFIFQNSQRLTTPNSTSLQRTSTDTRPLVQLDLRGTSGPADAFYAYAEAGATPAFDPSYDATKLPNTTGLNLSSTVGSEQLAIDGRPVFTAATVLPLSVGVPAAGSYSLEAAALRNLPAGLTAYLRDALTGTTTALSVGTRYAFTVSATQATALVQARFSMQFSAAAPLATSAAALAATVSLYPNPARTSTTVALPGVAGARTVQAELLNTLGQIVRRQSAALPASGTVFTLPTAGLAAGVYTLRLTAGPTIVTKRLTVE